LPVISTSKAAIVLQGNTYHFGLHEVHGLRAWQEHRDQHNIDGTLLASGGLLTAGTYQENTATDAANSFGLDAATLRDEDIDLLLAAWIQGTYTTLYIGAASEPIFSTVDTLPFRSAGSYPLINNPTTGANTATTTGKYVNVYPILVPVTADADSQKFRVMVLQPQAAYDSLAAAQAESINSLSLGTLGALLPEFKYFARVTYVTSAADNNTGKCRIATGGVSYITGTKNNPISVSGVAASNHAVLSNLAWLNSGHTGTASKRPTFSALGAAAEKDDTFISLLDIPSTYPTNPERGFGLRSITAVGTQNFDWSSQYGQDATGHWSRSMRMVDSGHNTLYTLPTAAPTANNQALVGNADFSMRWQTLSSLYLSDVNSLTNNYLPYKTASGLVDSLNFYDGTNTTFVGGTAAGSKITYKSTTGTGTTSGIAHQFLGGTNGGTVLGTWLNNGNLGIGGTPLYKLDVFGTRIRVQGSDPALILSDTGVSGEDWYLMSNGGAFFLQERNGGTFNTRFAVMDGGNTGLSNISPSTLLDQTQWSADALGSYHSYSKSRNATQGSHTILQNNDVIGGLQFRPSDGTDFGTISAQEAVEINIP